MKHHEAEGRQISFEEIAQPAPRPQPTAVAQRTVVRVKPKADHPWKRFPAVAKRGVNP